MPALSRQPNFGINNVVTEVSGWPFQGPWPDGESWTGTYSSTDSRDYRLISPANLCRKFGDPSQFLDKKQLKMTQESIIKKHNKVIIISLIY